MTCPSPPPATTAAPSAASVEQLSAMVKSIDFGPDETQPRIVALACENDAYPELGPNPYKF